MKKILASIFVLAALISFTALSFAQDAKSTSLDTTKTEQKQSVKPAKKVKKNKPSKKHKVTKKTEETKK